MISNPPHPRVRLFLHDRHITPLARIYVHFPFGHKTLTTHIADNRACSHRIYPQVHRKKEWEGFQAGCYSGCP